MDIATKIKLAESTTELTFFKEGIFYRLYNKQAMLFNKNCKPYKVSVKFYKNINQKVYSLGFPVASFNASFFNKNVTIVTSNHTLTIQNVTFAIIPNYTKWCSLFLEKKQQPTSIINSYEHLKEQVLAIQLASNTPLQVVQLLNELQTQLY